MGDEDTTNHGGRPQRTALAAGFLFTASILALLLALSVCRAPAPPPAAAEPELAVLMGELQRHSAKLGYAIAGRNRPLAAFYLAESEEALEAVRAVESWEGMPIAHPLGAIVDPLLPPLVAAVEAERWEAADGAYRVFLDGCNRCHAATEHEFLIVTPPAGPAPYNQRFDAPTSGRSR